MSLFKSALSSVKRLDFVFANAGMGESAYLPSGVSSPGDWVEPNLATINVNVIGVLYTTNLAVQVFKAQPVVDGFRGKVIVTGSIMYVVRLLWKVKVLTEDDCSCRSFNAVPYLPMYSTSKHALTGFIRSMGATLAPEGITVNGVGPNLTRESYSITQSRSGFKLIFMCVTMHRHGPDTASGIRRHGGYGDVNAHRDRH